MLDKISLKISRQLLQSVSWCLLSLGPSAATRRGNFPLPLPHTERWAGYEGEGEEGGRGVVGGGGGDGGGEGESERCDGMRGWESHLVRG